MKILKKKDSRIDKTAIKIDEKFKPKILEYNLDNESYKKINFKKTKSLTI